jgi:hypothetical protein
VNRKAVLERAIETYYAIAYDNDARHSFGGRAMPWTTHEGAQRFLDKNPTYLQRGGRVVELALVEVPPETE